MIVKCPDCASRFRLADHKLKSEGTKVRCSRCQKVFTVMPPESPPIADPGNEALSQTPGPGGAGFHEFDFGDARSGAELSDDSELDDDFSVDSDFDFNAFGSEQEQESDDFFSASGEGTDDFAFGESASLQDEADFTMGQDDEEDFFASSAPSSTEKPASGDVAGAFDFPSTASADAVSPGAQESFSEESNGFDEDLFGSVVPDEKGLGPLPPRARIPAPRKSRHRGLGFLLVLLLAVLAAGGYFGWKKGKVDLVGMIDMGRVRRLLHLDTPAVADGQIRTVGLNGFFLESRNAGRIFVIQGEAVNDYREPRSAIAVKGVLFDAKGAPLLQQTVFCGNPLDTDELTSKPFERIVEQMNNQFGDSLSNLNVPAGKTIPFTIVFRNLPAELNEFAVEVVDSKPASR